MRVVWPSVGNGCLDALLIGIHDEIDVAAPWVERNAGGPAKHTQSLRAELAAAQEVGLIQKLDG